MKHRPARHSRAPSSIRSKVFVFLLCIGIVGVFIFTFFGKSPKGRQSVVVVSNPLHVVSIDGSGQSAFVLDVPAATHIEGTRGYGSYRVESLYELDKLDNRGGSMFLESITEALGLPVGGWIEAPTPSHAPANLERVRSLFSWQSIFFSTTTSSLSFAQRLYFVKTLSQLKSDQIRFVTLDTALVDQSLPDGSSVRVLDPQRSDFLFGPLFTDTTLRSEGTTVTVQNATDTPTIGQRAARMLTNMGVSVIMVGNAQGANDRCLLEGTGESLKTNTAHFIATYFSCDKKISEQTGSSDLVLSLGEQYASRFKTQN